MLNLNLLNRALNRFFYKTRLWFVPLGLIVVVTCFFIPRPMPSIGVVNITGIINDFVATESKAAISPTDLRAKVKLFGNTLEKIVNDISVKKRIVLMPSEAVIAGAKDYTEEVQILLARAIKNSPQEKQRLPQDNKKIFYKELPIR
jgi:hypothetical protein